ncbi:hypothetical protein [uncultured Selenomonas sp.]|nr:hypothetical protein [uncultured Selenomonas sp.]
MIHHPTLFSPSFHLLYTPYMGRIETPLHGSPPHSCQYRDLV